MKMPIVVNWMSWFFVGGCCFVSISGCSSQDDASKPQATTEPARIQIDPETNEPIEPSAEAKEKMLAAKEALFTRLSGRLMETMSSQGAVAAIAVCQKEAPEIAEAVGAEHGLRIGRTGVRIRNSNNLAPTWAEPLVQAKTETPTFVTLQDNRSAALLPIKLQAQCVMCHGPKDQIAPMVEEQLARLYPNDEAVGFQEGELRGWFWIEL